MIVAASATLFSKWGGGTESALCGKKVKITSGSKSVEATIKDECPADECTVGSLDMSPAVFKELAELSVGRLTDLEWAFMDGDDSSSSSSASASATSSSSDSSASSSASSSHGGSHGHSRGPSGDH